MTTMASRIHPLRTFARDLRRRALSVGWGFAAQACSSATNFGLAIIAGHILGPGGLGRISVGFAAYFALLGFERALVTDPLIASSSARTALEQRASARHAVTVGFLAALPAAAGLAGLGLVLPAQIGRGMLLFAPWLVPALIQDLGRSIVFRDRRNHSSAFSDATWLMTMLVVSPLAFVFRSDWLVTGTWGVGALAGALVAITQIGWRPTTVPRALRWWKSRAWRFGRWLGAQQVLYTAATFTTVVALAGILGAQDYGGLRAIQSILAPLTLLGPAMALPGLPLVVRALDTSPRRGLVIAAHLAALTMVATLAYVVLIYQLPGALSLFFGREFLHFRSIIIPIGVGQVIAAPAFGLTLFLMAEQRGAGLLLVNTLNAGLYLAFAVVFGSAYGLHGAAWAYAASSAIGEAVLLLVLRRRLRELRK